MVGKRLNKEDRRKQIKEVALRLFTDKGYAKTTMDEIVQECGISKGGMYHHYANKEEIFVELLKDGGEYRKNIVLDYMRGNPKSRSEKIMDSLLDKVLDENPYKKLYTVFLIEMQSNKAFKELFEKVYDNSLEDFIEFCKKELDTLWDESKRLAYPHETYVDLSQKLWDMRYELLQKYNYQEL